MDIFRPWAKRKPTPDPQVQRLGSIVVIPARTYEDLADAHHRALAAEERELETRRLLDNLVTAIGTAPRSIILPAANAGYAEAPHVGWLPLQRANAEALAHLGRSI